MIWHIAFALDNLEEGMERFGAALNLDWLPVKHYVGESVDQNGRPYTLKTRLTFATAGPCALELFERVPGTPNEPAKGTAFHHMGYWTEDLSKERERLAACDWLHRGGPTEPDSRAAFFASTLGILIEGCNSTIERPGLAKYYPGVAPGMKQPHQGG
ncbi:VOC family protein [Actinomadura formosensis]|uniref:VOC family protein n=1 Tax=Actinomadura formosensis TaxID=60706 RepID=UPI00082A573D|nr:VOC family protein [Actinomadura formosensis]